MRIMLLSEFMGARIQKLIVSLQQLLTVPAVFIDGGLYAAVAVFTFLQSQFGTDEAAKFIDPLTLFWIRICVGAVAVLAFSLKMFRSTSYAEHQKKPTGETAFIQKTEVNK